MKKQLPLRNKGIAKRLFSNSGGQARALAAQAVESALKSLHTAAVEAHGEEHAAYILFKVVQQDPDQVVCPDWLKTEFAAHRDYILETGEGYESKIDGMRRNYRTVPRGER